MSLLATLPGFSTREAITDALSRVIPALDTNNPHLFKSAWVPVSASFIMNGNTMGLDDIFTLIGPLETTHSINNVRVDVKADASAHMTASALANHFRPGEGVDTEKKGCMGGSLYEADVVREGAMWRIKKWAMRVVLVV